MSIRESYINNIEEDDITKKCYAWKGMHAILNSQQRLALYSSKHPNFSISFKQRLDMKYARENNVSCNCEEIWAFHSSQ